MDSSFDSAGLAVDANRLNSLKYAARDGSDDAMAKVAKEFEALFLGKMMQQMRQAGFKSDLMNSKSVEFYQSMLDQQRAKDLSSRGVGLADMLLKQMQNKTPTMAPTEPQSAVAPPASPAAVNAPAAAPRVATDVSADTSGDPVRQFLDRFMAPAQKAAESTGLPQQLVLAQAALESNWGRSTATTTKGQSLNLFGIKATGGWQGETANAITQEYIEGVPESRRDKFRAYNTYDAAFADYSRLMSNTRYAAVRNATTPEQAAQELQRAGYATDPHYADKLIAVMKQIGAKVEQT